MDNDILFDVLKKCYEKGLNNAVDVTPELKNIFKNDGIFDSNLSNWRETPIYYFLN